MIGLEVLAADSLVVQVKSFPPLPLLAAGHFLIVGRTKSMLVKGDRRRLAESTLALQVRMARWDLAAAGEA